jgi:uncharacterized coiled-coil DUF342 family protein
VNDTLRRLRERRQSVLEEAVALAQRAQDERRPFTAAEQGQFDALSDHIEQLDKKINTERQRQ